MRHDKPDTSGERAGPEGSSHARDLPGRPLEAEVGDVTRFRSARQLQSNLGTVPTVCSSGGVTHKGDQPTPPGLSRTLFTQAVIHIEIGRAHV